MQYFSTKDSKNKVSSAQAIKKGLASDGGLFVPESIPMLTEQEIKSLVPMNYNERAKFVLSKLLTDYTESEIAYCVDSAYNTENFDNEKIAPIVKIDDTKYILELWHGPTSAFKDMALQILPYLLTTAMKKTNEEKTVVILVATSGDTGKAALEGFSDVEGTKIIVFYPSEGVSKIQKLQMSTQKGANVYVAAVKGNFDDAQRGVKEIFTDGEFAKELDGRKLVLSSANSINWGRLVPQIIYYISSYCQLVKEGEIEFGEKVNICVPTGNFGNILAAYYAKEMGIPVNKLICASNSNNVLTDFINTGVYDANRTFYTTMSPSMDILVSSNLERLIYHLSGDDGYVVELMNELSSKKKYEVSKKLADSVKEMMFASYCDEENTSKTIKNEFAKSGYLFDTHTAVASAVYDEYRKVSGDDTKTIIASTASPFKFNESVLRSLGSDANGDEFELIDELSRLSGCSIPKNLAALKDLDVRFDRVIEKNSMKDEVDGILK